MYNLMIVDDEPLTREYFKLNIHKLDERWEVVAEAMEGSEALEILDKLNIDLVITDIKMPVMDGLELCKVVSEKYPNIKLVILSGYDEFDFARQAVKYGVVDYILKPIVKEELKSMLGKVAKVLDEQKSRNLYLKALENLSDDAKNQIIKNFLKAVVLKSNVEVKYLYPLLYKWNVSLIESEGVIMILQIDEYLIFKKDLPFSDIHALKLILSQVTEDAIKDEKYCKAFFDNDGNTVLLISGEESENLDEKCIYIFQKIFNEFKNETNITISGACGIPVSDVLQLDSSYKSANDMLIKCLFSENSKLFKIDNSEEFIKCQERLNEIIFSVKAGFINKNEKDFITSLYRYTEFINKLDISLVLKFGIYLIKICAKFFGEENLEQSLNILKKGILDLKDNLSKEKIVQIYKNSIEILDESFINESLKDVDDEDIISKAKQYIYMHYSEPLSLEMIADKLCISPAYLSNIFHSETGESYIKFLTRIRMEEAAKLLKQKPTIKIYEVSRRVGYVSDKHFSYVFKKYYGITPGEYQILSDS